MILKDLIVFSIGGTGFFSLVGASGYFAHRQTIIKSIEEDINMTLGVINSDVQNLIGREVDKDGNIVKIENQYLTKQSSMSSTSEISAEKLQRIEEIMKKIKEAEDKNNNSWKYYVDGIKDITDRYKTIVENEKKPVISAKHLVPPKTKFIQTKKT